MVIVGGGITGLAAAHRWRELDPTAEIIVLEAHNRFGGVLESISEAGFLVERSADNFISNVPHAVNLCRRLGLESELISTNDTFRRAFVTRGNRLYPVPDGFMLMAAQKVWPILTTSLLSPVGKLRLLGEYFLPRRPVADESLASFVRRRLGREAFERLVQPLVGGIYTADAEKLSLAATLPRFLEMERAHGGLIRAALQQRKADRRGAKRPAHNGEPSPTASARPESGARYSLFLTLRQGMSQLVQALTERLGQVSLPGGISALHSGVSVQQLRPLPDGRWSVEIAPSTAAAATSTPPAIPGLGPTGSFTAQAVVLAVPAYHAAALIQPFHAELARELNQIEYAGSAVVSLGYRRDQVRHPLNGFGFVVPAIERRPILAGSFSSIKFAGRAPDGSVLIRVFMGGAMRPDLVQAPEAELRSIAESELASLLGISGPPTQAWVTRWPRRMPQYHLGHLDRVARIEAAVAAHPGLALAGSAYRGVGIPDCIRSGEKAAELLAAQPPATVSGNP